MPVLRSRRAHPILELVSAEGFRPGEPFHIFLEYAPWIVATLAIFYLARHLTVERRC